MDSKAIQGSVYCSIPKFPLYFYRIFNAVLKSSHWSGGEIYFRFFPWGSLGIFFARLGGRI